jgi:predicted transposase/invertase (TIGR01784 family)
METDAFFYRLLKYLPQTFFELLALPPDRSRSYRFDSVELKKSLRIDGLFLPNDPGLPFYLVEVQFQPVKTFYANLFAKVFCYLEENDPNQDWLAVVIFPSRSVEPAEQRPYQELLDSERVRRIYLDEFSMSGNPTYGLGILQLLSAEVEQAKSLTARLVQKAKSDAKDRALGRKVIELVEELLLRRFTRLNREEVRAMFELQDIRKSVIWQEAHEEGIEEGRKQKERELVKACVHIGMAYAEIAKLMKISEREVKRLAKKASK